MPPYAELAQERMGVWKRTPIFLRGGGDDRDGYEKRLCGENWRYGFVVNAMPAESAKHTQEEIVKALIAREAMALKDADIG